MKLEVSSIDDSNQPTVLEFEGVVPSVVGDTLLLFSEDGERLLYGFNPVMWSTFRVVED